MEEEISAIDPLEQYAEASNIKVLRSQSDLDPKDRAMPAMLVWCRKHANIVVLQNGNLLTNDPSSRVVQNCKIVMLNKNLRPGLVYPASSDLISMLLANAEEYVDQVDEVESVSTQQQRLRILVREAIDANVTDIHIEVRTEIARIRFRKHGELYLHAEWLPKLAREIASVAFNKETDHAITHFNPSIPQNASMPLRIDDREIRLRLASLPAHGGYDVVMRLLTAADDKVASLEDLGYLPSQITLIKKAVSMPHGAIILSGPTGSGKTTTLASCMRLINQERKVFTIEDPVEKVVGTTTQVPVNTEHYDRSFASMARTALRMDPDVIVFGEMRDEDTAHEMVRAAITGHLVFSTTHSNSAPEIVTRINNLGIPYKMLASPDMLVCLICQRLVPLLCRECAIPVAQAETHQDHLPRWFDALQENYLQLKARGNKDCKKCNGLGIASRTVVAEIVWVDEPSRHFIQEADTLGWTEYLKKNGWKSYRDHLMVLVKAGVCDPLDAEKMMGEIIPCPESQFQYGLKGDA